MANNSLFASLRDRLRPAAARNHHGAPAYAFTPEHALAQYAVTGCLNGTYYAAAQEQLDTVIRLASQCPPDFVARTAVYARERGYMKDMPALLAAVLSVSAPEVLERVFPRIITDVKMLRNFVQIVRSGAVGRKSLASMPRRLVRQWLAAQTEEQLFRGSVGQSPSLADVIRMAHPRPAGKIREAFYGWLLGREHDASLLPRSVKEFNAFKAGEVRRPPDVPFPMLTALPLSTDQWTAIAENAPWQATRMNLNTFARHGVFESGRMVQRIAARLADPDAIRRARVFPYQLMMAWKSGTGLPLPIRNALQDAMEIALENIPAINGRVAICVDVSGSMQSPVTGHRAGATTAVRCLDVAGLIGAAILRRNPDACILPFSDDVVPVDLNPRDTVLTNAEKLARLPSGGTNCSAPLRWLNQHRRDVDLVFFVSDNESWVDAPHYGRFGGGATRTMQEWADIQRRNPQAKMICLDIQPYGTTQAADRRDILNIGGFSDAVFPIAALFASGELGGDHWVDLIRRIQI